MKKIVEKVRVKSKDDFEERIGRRGYDFGPLYWEHDRIYLPRGYKKGENYPRFVMRTEMRAVDRPPRYFLILKRHIEDSDIEVEHATLIKDYMEAVGMISQLGFTLETEISRKRQSVKLRDGKTLYFDKIDGENGFFAKIEAEIKEDDKVEEVRRDVRETFGQFGEQNFIQQSYAEILKNKA